MASFSSLTRLDTDFLHQLQSISSYFILEYSHSYLSYRLKHHFCFFIYLFVYFLTNQVTHEAKDAGEGKSLIWCTKKKNVLNVINLI